MRQPTFLSLDFETKCHQEYIIFSGYRVRNTSTQLFLMTFGSVRITKTMTFGLPDTVLKHFIKERRHLPWKVLDGPELEEPEVFLNMRWPFYALIVSSDIALLN